MPIDDEAAIAADVKFEPAKPEKKKDESEAPDDDELVTIVISTSEDGEREPVRIPDRREGGWVEFKRNEPVQVPRRFLRQMGTSGPYKPIRHKDEIDPRTQCKKIIRKVWRFPYHEID